MLKCAETGEHPPSNERGKFRGPHLTCLDTQWCPILYDPMDYSPPDSSVHGIFQARILEWVAISFSINYLGRGLIHMIFVKIYLNATFKAYLMENKINFYVFFIGYYYSFQLPTLLSSLFGDTDNQIIKAYELLISIYFPII